MARVRRVWSTARVTREGEEAGTSETTPISEMMRRSGLIVQEEKETYPTEDVVDVEVEPTTVEADGEDEDDDDILSPSKPSHIEFGKSTITSEDLVLMKKLGYFGENDDKLVRFAREEVIPEPKDDEVVVFRSFFKAGLRFPLYKMIGEVLKKFEIYLHQLTPTPLLDSACTYGLSKAKGRVGTPKGFAGCMSSTIRRRLELMFCKRTSDATTSHTERILKLM
jgi:hypothetical protein